MHGYAVYARRFLLSDFVSVENKGAKIYFPKLDVAGSIPVARSIFAEYLLISTFRFQRTSEQR
jgi:hypothetical protein